MKPEALNLLAFAWHTVLELLEPPLEAAREARHQANQLLSPHPDADHYVAFPSWLVIVGYLTNFSIPAEFVKCLYSP